MFSKRSFIIGLILLSISQYNLAVSQENLRGLVLLIDFVDDPEDLPMERVDSLINGLSYTEALVPSSLRNYWMVQSRDSISLTHEIFGYYQAPETAAWYAEQEWPVVYDLLTDALDSAVAQNPDFDWDELSLSMRPGFDGTFLSINVVTTAWVAGSGGTHYLPAGAWVAPNGIEVRAFTSQALTSPWDPDFVRLFVIAHEIGHAAWGFPDTYDYDGSSFGTGFYSVMSGNQVAGEVEPIGGPFYMKTGWANVVDILPNSTYILPQDGKLIARYINPDNPNEYFIIEACMNSTLGNAAFPVERGLVIWHIDEDVITFNTLENMTLEEHYAYSIEQADGQFDLENGVNQGDAGDIFVEGSLFDESSIPSSNWWNGENSGLAINSIQFLPDNSIQFCNGLCDLSFPTEDLSNRVLIRENNSIHGVSITFLTSNATQYNVEILNMLGETLYSNSIDAEGNGQAITKDIQLDYQAKGIILVRVTDKNTGSSSLKKVMLN